jgi:ElaB/YqjD/DUF883 family membrane-anchored ribosome-binding protein
MNKNGMTDVGSTTNRIDEKVDALKDSVKGIVDQGAQKAEAIKTKVVEVKDRAFDRGSDALDSLTSMIKAHPLKAIAIAFGAGYIGMRLFRR